MIFLIWTVNLEYCNNSIPAELDVGNAETVPPLTYSINSVAVYRCKLGYKFGGTLPSQQYLMCVSNSQTRGDWRYASASGNVELAQNLPATAPLCTCKLYCFGHLKHYYALSTHNIRLSFLFLREIWKYPLTFENFFAKRKK